MANDWNNKLHIYITFYKRKTNHSRPEMYGWYENQRINPWKYWYRLNKWTVNSIIKDPFTVHDVNYYYQVKYRNNKTG